MAIEGAVTQPTAIANGQQSAVAHLGEVIKDLIHRSGTYLTESALHDAENVVTAWVNAHVPGSAMRALATGDERAAPEDVSLRVPPGGLIARPPAAPPIDYDRLAAALMARGFGQPQQPPAAPVVVPPQVVFPQ
jgi:hypothetical protein